MSKEYTLDQKIEALNLLDQLDGDVHRGRKQLGIPVKTLRGWRGDSDTLRRKFDQRQFRHFANIKQSLLNDMLATAQDIMETIKSGDHPGIAVSQLTNAVDTLLRNAKQLEENYVRVALDAGDSPNRTEYVYDHKVQDAAPWTAGDPEQPGSLQSPGVRAALGQIGVGQN